MMIIIDCMSEVSLPCDFDGLVKTEISFKLQVDNLGYVRVYMIYKELSNETDYASIPVATSHLAYRK